MPPMYCVTLLVIVWPAPESHMMYWPGCPPARQSETVPVLPPTMPPMYRDVVYAS